jgi:hypothetical protein
MERTRRSLLTGRPPSSRWARMRGSSSPPCNIPVSPTTILPRNATAYCPDAAPARRVSAQPLLASRHRAFVEVRLYLNDQGLGRPQYDKSFIQSGNSPAPNATSTTAPRAAITFPVGRFISGMPVTHRIIWIQLPVEGECKLIEVKRVVSPHRGAGACLTAPRLAGLRWDIEMSWVSDYTVHSTCRLVCALVDRVKIW